MGILENTDMRWGMIKKYGQVIFELFSKVSQYYYFTSYSKLINMPLIVERFSVIKNNSWFYVVLNLLNIN